MVTFKSIESDKDKAIAKIEKAVLCGEPPSSDYTRLIELMYHYFDSIKLKKFAKFVKSEYNN